MKNLIYRLTLAISLVAIVAAADAQNLRVATAANLQSIIKVLQADFAKKTGIIIEPIIGSSGNLSAQIRNGAPFDVFMSADMSFPLALYKDGLGSKPLIYATGSLIICSNRDIGFENWEHTLQRADIKKIAIANPALAPYGKAAEEALLHKGILNEVKPKIVTGESISQVNTYIGTGVVDAGFTTQSVVKELEGKTKLYWVPVSRNLYNPIEQGVIKLKRADKNDNAEKFILYLSGSSAKAIFKEFGYLVN